MILRSRRTKGTTLDEQQLSRLIGRIYDSVSDHEEYSRVMKQVAEATRSRLLMPALVCSGGNSLEGPQRFGDMTSRLLDGSIDYDAGAGALDPTITFVQANPNQGVFATNLHLGRNEYAHHPHVKWNRHYIGASHWRLRYEARDGVLFGVSAHPRDPIEPHANDEVRKFDLLFEHMARAWRQALRPYDLTSRTEALATINVAGRVTALSLPAEDIIQERDGLYLHGGVLLPSETRLRSKWRELVDRTLHSLYDCEGSILLTRPSGKRSPLVTVRSLPRRAGLIAFAHGAVVRVVDPESDSPNLAKLLIALWRLTWAEARLVQVLVETDCDLRRSADLLGVTYATVRTQLASVFAKSETRGQPELMRLVTRLSG